MKFSKRMKYILPIALTGVGLTTASIISTSNLLGIKRPRWNVPYNQSEAAPVESPQNPLVGPANYVSYKALPYETWTKWMPEYSGTRKLRKVLSSSTAKVNLTAMSAYDDWNNFYRTNDMKSSTRKGTYWRFGNSSNTAIDPKTGYTTSASGKRLEFTPSKDAPLVGIDGADTTWTPAFYIGGDNRYMFNSSGFNDRLTSWEEVVTKEPYYGTYGMGFDTSSGSSGFQVTSEVPNRYEWKGWNKYGREDRNGSLSNRYFGRTWQLDSSIYYTRHSDNNQNYLDNSRYSGQNLYMGSKGGDGYAGVVQFSIPVFSISAPLGTFVDVAKSPTGKRDYIGFSLSDESTWKEMWWSNLPINDDANAGAFHEGLLQLPSSDYSSTRSKSISAKTTDLLYWGSLIITSTMTGQLLFSYDSYDSSNVGMYMSIPNVSYNNPSSISTVTTTSKHSVYPSEALANPSLATHILTLNNYDLPSSYYNCCVQVSYSDDLGKIKFRIKRPVLESYGNYFQAFKSYGYSSWYEYTITGFKNNYTNYDTNTTIDLPESVAAKIVASTYIKQEEVMDTIWAAMTEGYYQKGGNYRNDSTEPDLIMNNWDRIPGFKKSDIVFPNEPNYDIRSGTISVSIRPKKYITPTGEVRTDDNGPRGNIRISGFGRVTDRTSINKRVINIGANNTLDEYMNVGNGLKKITDMLYKYQKDTGFNSDDALFTNMDENLLNDNPFTVHDYQVNYVQGTIDVSISLKKVYDPKESISSSVVVPKPKIERIRLTGFKGSDSKIFSVNTTTRLLVNGSLLGQSGSSDADGAQPGLQVRMTDLKAPEDFLPYDRGYGQDILSMVYSPVEEVYLALILDEATGQLVAATSPEPYDFQVTHDEYEYLNDKRNVNSSLKNENVLTSMRIVPLNNPTGVPHSFFVFPIIGSGAVDYNDPGFYISFNDRGVMKNDIRRLDYGVLLPKEDGDPEGTIKSILSLGGYDNLDGTIHLNYVMTNGTENIQFRALDLKTEGRDKIVPEAGKKYRGKILDQNSIEQKLSQINLNNTAFLQPYLYYGENIMNFYQINMPTVKLEEGVYSATFNRLNADIAANVSYQPYIFDQIDSKKAPEGFKFKKIVSYNDPTTTYNLKNSRAESSSNWAYISGANTHKTYSVAGKYGNMTASQWLEQDESWRLREVRNLVSRNLDDLVSDVKNDKTKILKSLRITFPYTKADDDNGTVSNISLYWPDVGNDTGNKGVYQTLNFNGFKTFVDKVDEASDYRSYTTDVSVASLESDSVVPSDLSTYFYANGIENIYSSVSQRFLIYNLRSKSDALIPKEYQAKPFICIYDSELRQKYLVILGDSNTKVATPDETTRFNENVIVMPDQMLNDDYKIINFDSSPTINPLPKAILKTDSVFTKINNIEAKRSTNIYKDYETFQTKKEAFIEKIIRRTIADEFQIYGIGRINDTTKDSELLIGEFIWDFDKGTLRFPVTIMNSITSSLTVQPETIVFTFKYTNTNRFTEVTPAANRWAATSITDLEKEVENMNKTNGYAPWFSVTSSLNTEFKPDFKPKITHVEIVSKDEVSDTAILAVVVDKALVNVNGSAQMVTNYPVEVKVIMKKKNLSIPDEISVASNASLSNLPPSEFVNIITGNGTEAERKRLSNELANELINAMRSTKFLKPEDIIIKNEFTFNNATGIIKASVSIPSLASPDQISSSPFIEHKISISGFKNFPPTTVEPVDFNLVKAEFPEVATLSPSRLQDYINSKWYNIYKFVSISNPYGGTQPWQAWTIVDDGSGAGGVAKRNPAYNEAELEAYTPEKVKQIELNNTTLQGRVVKPVEDVTGTAKVDIFVKNGYAKEDNSPLINKDGKYVPRPESVSQQQVTITGLSKTENGIDTIFSDEIEFKPSMDSSLSGLVPHVIMDSESLKERLINNVIKPSAQSLPASAKIKINKAVVNNRVGSINLEIEPTKISKGGSEVENIAPGSSKPIIVYNITINGFATVSSPTTLEAVSNSITTDVKIYDLKDKLFTKDGLIEPTAGMTYLNKFITIKNAPSANIASLIENGTVCDVDVKKQTAVVKFRLRDFYANDSLYTALHGMEVTFNIKSTSDATYVLGYSTRYVDNSGKEVISTKYTRYGEALLQHETQYETIKSNAEKASITNSIILALSLSGLVVLVALSLVLYKRKKFKA